MNRIKICDIPVDSLSMKETVALIDTSIREKKTIHHVVINAVKVSNAQKNKELKDSIVNCDIINADGQGIVWASRFLGTPLPERVAGIDLMQELVKLAADKKYRIFLFGAKEEIVKSVVDIYSQKYGKDIIAGYRNGYFSNQEEPEIAKLIANSNADMLFVAMSSPKKEIFLNTYKDVIKTSFIMGVGGSFDVIAGFVKRAPKFMQQWGLEWFFRVLQEPKRMWKRYLIGNSSFIFLVFKYKFKMYYEKKLKKVN